MAFQQIWQVISNFPRKRMEKLRITRGEPLYLCVVASLHHAIVFFFFIIIIMCRLRRAIHKLRLPIHCTLDSGHPRQREPLVTPFREESWHNEWRSDSKRWCQDSRQSPISKPLHGCGMNVFNQHHKYPEEILVSPLWKAFVNYKVLYAYNRFLKQ